MLTLDQICQKYGERLVLKNITCTMAEGKIYGIIGPNGAGKSTLLRVMTAMERPLKGQVFWEGRPFLQPIPEVTCMWQKPYLFQSTVRENILYGLKIRGWSKAQQEERLEHILEIFRLREHAQRMSHTLSGGEGARVACARAVAPRPRLLALDEPAANLDPTHTLLLENSLRTICAEENMTVIIVTHDMFQAKRLAWETLFLMDGALEERGPTEDIFSSPQSEKTRKFISGEL